MEEKKLPSLQDLEHRYEDNEELLMMLLLNYPLHVRGLPDLLQEYTYLKESLIFLFLNGYGATPAPASHRRGSRRSSGVTENI